MYKDWWMTVEYTEHLCYIKGVLYVGYVLLCAVV